jgi:hypothetical protein
VSGISRFQRALLQDGYLNTDYEQITGVTLLLYVLQPHLDRSPRIDLIKPTGGATVHGTYFLDAEPSFYSGVRRMAFEVTGRRSKKTVMYQATFSPFGWYYQWDTTQVADGTYSVRAIAHKGAGKSKDSQAVTIKVAN